MERSLFMCSVPGLPERIVMRRLSWHRGGRKKRCGEFLSPVAVWQFVYSELWLAGLKA